MLQYIYFVKCPDCEDEHFDFFNDAKDFALGCLSKKPIITQIEVDRNDFGECVDSHDLGTIWSWEDMVTTEEPAVSVFTKDDLKTLEHDPEFDNLDNSLDFVPDNFRKPIPTDMTPEDLVEEMEENEDMVECKWCEDLFDKSECRYEVDLGWLCSRCEAAIKSRGETLTFRENSYWDFLDEEIATEEPLREAVAFNPQDTIELHYDKIKVSIVTREIPATYWEPADYEEETVTNYFDYEVKIDDVATVLWENFLTDEDVTDVPGGFDTLEDEDAWYKYLAEHFDDLVEKYNKELLDYYEESAKEAAQEKFQDEYDNYEPEYFYDESLNIGKSKSILEELEDSETYRSRLSLCPECDTHSFDNETGICIKCGFN